MRQPRLFSGLVFSGAEFSPCLKYRYELTRFWDGSNRHAAFVMLNPSTADANEDDPTIRKCVGFARRWGYGGIRVYNVYALRATDPNELKRSDNPIGPDNDSWIRRAASNEIVVAAWGTFRVHPDRAQHVLGLLNGASVHCLRVTKEGRPQHPLYLPNNARPIPYAP